MFDISLKIGTFRSFYYADFILNRAIEIARLYGYITLADILELVGEKSGYTDRKYGWTYSTISDGVIAPTDKETYTISLPKFDWFDEYAKADKAPKSSVKQDHPDPEPINVTLPSDKLERTISILFKDLDKIKGRPVFINIM